MKKITLTLILALSATGAFAWNSSIYQPPVYAPAPVPAPSPFLGGIKTQPQWSTPQYTPPVRNANPFSTYNIKGQTFTCTTLGTFTSCN